MKFLFLYVWIVSLMRLASVDGQLGLTIFYPKYPTSKQMDAFSTGSFEKWPSSPYECGNDLSNPMAPASLSCESTLRPKTPEGIRKYGAPMPPCTSLGIVFEYLQWATWSHKCWAVPVNPTNTQQGRLDAAFQANALDARNVVIYQHDAHVFSVNKAIEVFYMDKEQDIHQTLLTRDTKLENLGAWVASQKAVSAQYWFGGRWLCDLQTYHHANKVRAATNKEAESTIIEREMQFWRDTYKHRMAIVQLDHLVGVYFEKLMMGRTQECRDWAGYGIPNPEFPPNFRA